MTTRKTEIVTMKNILSTLVLTAALVAPSVAFAGKGATYNSIANAIATGNRDSIVSEIERAEKLPCAPCVDLVMPLIDHGNMDVRDVAAWWLSKRGIREQVKGDMIARLQGGDSVAARNAAEVLGRFMHPDVLMELEIAMHAEQLSEEARASAAAAIGRIGDYRGKAMLEGALTSESAQVRAAAAKALRNILGNTDAGVVTELLHDVEESVVNEAVLTVGVLRETLALPDLVDVVTDQTLSAKVRKNAAWALGKIGDGSAKDVLAAVEADDPDMLVRGAARAALATLR